MFKVAFVIRKSGSYIFGEKPCKYWFKSETDANIFYNDLENFIDEKTGGDFYVVYKSKPEKMSSLHGSPMNGYDPVIKHLYLVD